MRLKLIACNVFMRELCLCIPQTPHVVDLEFLDVGEHVRPDVLRASLQQRIDASAAGDKRYDAILLAYGVCGNAGIGLQARSVSLILPRAHDCCTVLLGSRAEFERHFKDHPSTPFGSVGYMERGDYFLRLTTDSECQTESESLQAYVEKYGEENARYIWESLHPQGEPGSNRAVFIDLPETAHLGFAERYRQKAEAEGKTYVRLEGNLRLIRALVMGEWNVADFLTVLPGQKTVGVYDGSEIIRAAP